ncbi:MAG: TonB-dependent receptor plug domain-containing protein, partial [Cytophagales bacterium]
PGVFGEYTRTILPRITMIFGLRADYHNLFGLFVTPRFHGKYDITETTILRVSAGRGQRTANVLAENSGILASSRNISIQNYGITETSFAGKPINYQNYGLKPEVAWNYGLSLTQEFRLFYRNGSITADFYRTDFQNQIVIDMDASAQQLKLYNLTGQSYSNSAQLEIEYELIDKLDLRLAYRYYDVKTDYSAGLLQKPLLSQNRAFINLAYETKSKWKFDLTTNWNGQKRIPNTTTNPEDFKRESYAPDFVTMNAQISKSFGNPKKSWWDLYIGVENLTDFRQKDLIIAANNPFDTYFDASLVWGPIIGRMTYAGFRYKFK